MNIHKASLVVLGVLMLVASGCTQITGGGESQTETDLSSSASTSEEGSVSENADSSITMIPSLLPDAKMGQAYQFSLQVVGGSAPYTWQFDSLPNGIILAVNEGDTSKATLTGTAMATGASDVTCKICDGSSPSKCLETKTPLRVTH
ncbi:MAG: hypothetical protein WC956_03320 [bacterium]